MQRPGLGVHKGLPHHSDATKHAILAAEWMPIGMCPWMRIELFKGCGVHSSMKHTVDRFLFKEHVVIRQNRHHHTMLRPRVSRGEVSFEQCLQLGELFMRVLEVTNNNIDSLSARSAGDAPAFAEKLASLSFGLRRYGAMLSKILRSALYEYSLLP